MTHPTDTSQGPALQPTPYKVLVACALDETADWALLEGIRLISGRPGELHIVHAVDQRQYSVADDTMRALDAGLDHASEVIRMRLERLWPAETDGRVVAHFRAGRASDTILQVAVDIDADVVVVGSHHGSGTRKTLTRSVVGKVLQFAHCPVLVALPKNYGADTPSIRVEPVCQDCVTIRQRTDAETYWCERHARDYLKPRIYIPKQEGRASVMSTY